MIEAQEKLLINLYAEVLSLMQDEDKRMKKLSEFYRICGPLIADWDERMKDRLTENGNKYAEEAIKTVDAFLDTLQDNYEGYENEQRFGLRFCRISVTYDTDSMENMEISVEGVSDVNEMSLEELKRYYEDLQAELVDLNDEEPENENSEEHEEWEEELSDLMGLIDKASERLEELGEEV